MRSPGRAVGVTASVGAAAWLAATGAAPAGAESGDIEAVKALAALANGSPGIGFQEPEAVINRSLSGNEIYQDGAVQTTAIEGSFDGNLGITSVNQDAGNLNNQANVRVVTVLGARSAATVLDYGGNANVTGNTVYSSGGMRSDTIHDSFDGGRGIVGVNQSAGNLNQQANVVLLTFGGQPVVDGLVVLSDAALADEVGAAENDVGPVDQPRSDSLTDSFEGFRGIAQVTQSSGDLNQISASIGMTFAVGVVP